MLAPTHMVFGSSLSLIVLAVFGLSSSLHWSVVGCAIIGSLLPDIDTPKSRIGRLMPPLSRWLEKRYGHRNMTHSLLAWLGVSAGFAIVIALASFFTQVPASFQVRWMGALSIGYLSHLILDMFNPTGVALLWPYPGRDVAIGNPNYRPASGAKEERFIFIGLCFLLILSLPLSEYGLSHSLRWILATPDSAIRQSLNMSTHCYVEFEGVNAHTRQKMSGRGDLLESKNNQLYLYYNNKVYTLGRKETADIIASKVRVFATEVPLDIETRHISKKSRADILRDIPNSVLISGIIQLPKGIDMVVPRTLSNTMTQTGRNLTLHYASKADLNALTLAETYIYQNKRAQHTLLQLQNRYAKTQAEYDTLSESDGLTERGRELLLSAKEKQRQDQQKTLLSDSLSRLQLDIEAQKRLLEDQALVFSGTIQLRPLLIEKPESTSIMSLSLDYLLQGNFMPKGVQK